MILGSLKMLRNSIPASLLLTLNPKVKLLPLMLLCQKDMQLRLQHRNRIAENLSPDP